ncbi:MAG: hypothetical protein AUH41_08250 [Gemmatimonadetes bacterium 13_1_40CM_66_11]|nr:MAG: hypothetical protein AUH41_08250 [Gemmatimonadetes bacterium 13_1_40CM_66_11]
MFKKMTVAVAALSLAAACNQDPAGTSSTNELLLAQNSQTIADNVAATPGGGTNLEGWFRRLIDTLRTTDDPVAIAYLDSARINRDSGWAARQRGDTAAARAFRRAAFRDVLWAVIELFPNAPERTGLAVDTAIAKIEQFLGTRDAPRIRAILAHVKALRVEADQAFVNGDKVTALALNLRGMQILHRLVEHIRYADRDHDDVADTEMQAVSF